MEKLQLKLMKLFNETKKIRKFVKTPTGEKKKGQA